MAEILDITQDIQKEEKNLKKLDEVISLSDKKEDIKRMAEEFKMMFDDIRKIEKKIGKIKNKDDKEALEKQMQDLQKDIADLRDDGNINTSNILQTQEEIIADTKALEEFIKEHIKETRSKVHVAVGTEYKENSKDINTTSEERTILWGSKTATFEDGLKIDRIETPSNKDINLKITDPETMKAIKEGTLKILKYPGCRVDRFQDGNKYRCTISIENITIEKLEDEGYVQNLGRDIDIKKNEDRQYGNMKTAVTKLIDIMKISKDTSEEKYKQILEIGNTLSQEEKIGFLTTLSGYLSNIYDWKLYKEKKAFLNDFGKDKSTSTEDLLTKDIAGICADHHRLVAMIAEDLGMDAGVVSVTSSGLHAITRLKNGEEYILIDYGEMYRSQDPEDLIASYYAAQGSTPKPIDIVTDASGKIIGTITTRLGETIGNRLSPYGNIDSGEVAENMAEKGMKTIQEGTEYDVRATNQNQEVVMKYGTENGKYELLSKITNNTNIDNASTTGVNLSFRNLSESQKSETSINAVYNNTRWENSNQANNLGLGFGYAYRFDTKHIGDVGINQAVVGQLGVGFDMNKDIGETDFKGKKIGVMNWETPSLIGSLGYAASTENIKISDNIGVQGYGSIEGKLLPKKIDSPVNTMSIKPKVELGAKTNIQLGNDANLSIGGKASVINYSKGASEIGYGANINIAAKNRNAYASIAGTKHTMSEESILADRLMRQIGAERKPTTNARGQGLSVFSNISGSEINGNRKVIQTNTGIKYNF